MIAPFPRKACGRNGVADMFRVLAPSLAGLAALALAGAAAAQPVATAQGREGELSTAQQIEAWTHDDAPPPARVIRPGAAPLGADSPWADGLATPLPIIPFDAPPIARTLADGRIHGEVGAEVGNRGYGGYAVASGPLGKNGAVQVGVSDFQGTGGRRGGYWNGDHKSLNVTAVFDFSHDHRAADPSSPAGPAAEPGN